MNGIKYLRDDIRKLKSFKQLWLLNEGIVHPQWRCTCSPFSVQQQLTVTKWLSWA